MNIELYNGSNSFTAELQVDEDTGEILATCPLGVLVQRNPVGTAAYILKETTNAEMIDQHIKLMVVKSKSIKANIERARESLKQVMKATGTSSIKSLDGTFKATLHVDRDISVDVFDDTQLPSDYTVEKITYQADKKLIRKALDDGFDVPGARLLRKDRLSIS